MAVDFALQRIFIHIVCGWICQSLPTFIKIRIVDLICSLHYSILHPGTKTSQPFLWIDLVDEVVALPLAIVEKM
jgi:hypothetical protein